MALKTGSQLTEAEGLLLCAGGQIVAEIPAQPGSGDAGGSTLPAGKRYIDTASGVKVPAVKPGTCLLSFDERELSLKAAQALPASD